MEEKKLKHLEFIQNTINRMSANSFLIKGWLITLISALFVLSDKKNNQNFILILYLSIPVFWYINAVFLKLERSYRDLYDNVRNKNEEEIDFNMNIDDYNDGIKSTLKAAISHTIWPLYTFVFLVIVLIIYVF